MPVSANALVELTDAATPLVRRSKGRLASDEAVAAGRIHDFMLDRQQVRLGELVRACALSPQVLAALIRCGALEVTDPTMLAGHCDRCGTKSVTALCDRCRARLLGATSPEPAPSPTRVAAPAAARRMHTSSRRSALHTRR